MAKKIPQLHVFAHARWDREGRYTLSETRLHAVGVLDGLLAALETDPAGPATILDGQAILIEDYLAVRTDKSAAVAAAVDTGKLLVGPWYVLPHLQLVDPEAVIRNLLVGTRLARDLGGIFDIAYMPDACQYLPQLPQILSGFGIESAVVALGPHIAPGLVQWGARDGSSVWAINLAETAQPINSGGQTLKQVAASARAAATGPGVDFFFPYTPIETVNSNASADYIRDLGSLLKNMSLDGDGLAETLGKLRAVNPALPTISAEDLPELKIPGSLSNRVRLKLRNHEVETLLIAWAEPFSAWAWLASGDDAGTPGHVALDITRHAWKTVLQNHHQATIGGCVVDGVYDEAMLRFDQAEQVAESLVGRSLQAVSSLIDTGTQRKQKNTIPLVAFNAAGSMRSDLVSAHVSLPDTQQPYELLDTEGQLVAFELIRSAAENAPCIVRFVAADVPAAGYRTYFLRPGSAENPQPRQRDENSDIENEFFTVTFDPQSGQLGIFDKRSGRSYAGLNHFIDEGDCGTLQEFQTPARDTVIDIATNTPIFVEREVSNIEQTLSFLQIYRLPRQLTDQRDARLPLAAQFVPISITTLVRLIPGVARIDIRVSVANDAMDHRLSACFTLGSEIERIVADGHFEIRDCASGSAEVAGIRIESPRNFVTLWGAETGLTIANRGLHEITLRNSHAGPQVALSLLRSTGLLRIEDESGEFDAVYLDTPKAQCRGEAVFYYSLIPHGQDPLPAWREAWAFQSDMRAEAAVVHGGPLPTSGSLISVDNPRFVISAIKTGEDGQSLIVRGYNISDAVETVRLVPGVPRLIAQRARIDETPNDLPLAQDPDGSLLFDAHPSEIVTIRFEQRIS